MLRVCVCVRASVCVCVCVYENTKNKKYMIYVHLCSRTGIGGLAMQDLELGTQFTCFTSTKVLILTQKALLEAGQWRFLEPHHIRALTEPS